MQNAIYQIKIGRHVDLMTIIESLTEKITQMENEFKFKNKNFVNIQFQGLYNQFGNSLDLRESIKVKRLEKYQIQDLMGKSLEKFMHQIYKQDKRRGCIAFQFHQFRKIREQNQNNSYGQKSRTSQDNIKYYFGDVKVFGNVGNHLEEFYQYYGEVKCFE